MMAASVSEESEKDEDQEAHYPTGYRTNGRIDGGLQFGVGRQSSLAYRPAHDGRRHDEHHAEQPFYQIASP